MALDGVSRAEITDKASESVERDQTARMCRLILIYTLRKNKSVVANGNIRFKKHRKDELSLQISIQSADRTEVFFAINHLAELSFVILSYTPLQWANWQESCQTENVFLLLNCFMCNIVKRTAQADMGRYFFSNV